MAPQLLLLLLGGAAATIYALKGPGPRAVPKGTSRLCFKAGTGDMTSQLRLLFASVTRDGDCYTVQAPEAFHVNLPNLVQIGACCAGCAQHRVGARTAAETMASIWGWQSKGPVFLGYAVNERVARELVRQPQHMFKKVTWERTPYPSPKSDARWPSPWVNVMVGDFMKRSGRLVARSPNENAAFGIKHIAQNMDPGIESFFKGAYAILPDGQVSV